MKITTGGRWCRCPRRAGALTVMAGLVLLAAACGGSPSSTSSSSSNAGGSTQEQQDLAYAQCMRSHGVADFPDPNPGGGFGGRTNEVRNNPHFATADSACHHLLPGGGTENKVQQNESAFLQHAQCMRSHGVPNYPDPNPGVNPRTALQQAGINVNSPQVQAASRICGRLLPAQGSKS